MACSKHSPPCRTHLFEWKPVSGGHPSVPPVQLAFCPYSQRNEACDASSSQTLPNIFPVFNFDRKDYTTGFILPCDRHYIQQNDSFEKDRFERWKASKVQSQDQPDSQVITQFVPRPTNSNSYCHVCRLHYQDYLEHISTQKHISVMQTSLGQNYIEQLTKLYPRERIHQKRKKQQSISLRLKTRRSLRIREEKKKQKEQSVGEASTVTSQRAQRYDKRITHRKGLPQRQLRQQRF